MVKVAVVLAGCGYLDGAEIREAVLSLLYLDKAGADVSVFAPDQNQHHVVNHVTGEETQETRNVLVESARIARGKIAPLSDAKADAFDALVLPGGFGVAKNLSDLAFKGGDCQVNEAYARLINAFLEQKKPIGAMCITPAVLVAAIKGKGAKVTIGDDADTASVIEGLGGVHVDCASDNMVHDEAHNITTCAAYMREDPIADIAEGIEKVVNRVIESAQAAKKAAA